MAITKNQIGKEMHGKLDGFTVYQRLGQTIIRTIAGVRPTGAGQLAQQERLKGCTIFYKAVRAAGLSPYWKQVEKLPGQTGYNRFISLNLPAFSDKGWIEAPEKVHLTEKARLELPEEITCNPVPDTPEETRWRITWKDKTGYPSRQATDQAIIAVMRGGKHFDVKFIEPTGNALRGEGQLEFVKPENLEEYVYGYLFFQSTAGDQVSASHYLGSLL